MKKIVILSVLSLISFGALAQSRAEVRRAAKIEREAQRAAQVDSLIAACEFTFVAERAVSSLPSKPYITLSGTNDMIVRKDSISCHLPFYGRLYSAPIGANQGPLNFESTDFTYKNLTDKPSKNLIEIKIGKSTTPVPNNTYTIVIEIFDDGTAVTNITMTNGSVQMFYGYIQANEKI